MALPPRLIPFPWETVFPTVDNNLPYGVRFAEVDALMRNPDNRGSNLVVKLRGGAWTDFSPGLELPGGFPTATIPYKYWDVLWPTTEYGWNIDPWGYYCSLSSVPELAAANTSDAQWYRNYSTGLIVGTPFTDHTYEGCFATFGNGGYGYVSADWQNEPISYEQWFEENPNRPNPLWGFTGYTTFGDQTNIGVGGTGYNGAPADIWRRRLVCGILKRSAVLETCGPEDVMLGGIWTSDGVTTTLQVCINGAVLATKSWATIYGVHPSPAGSYDAGGNVWFDSAWEGAARDVEVWPGTVDEFQLGFIDSGGEYQWHVMSQYPPGTGPGANPYWIQVAGYDTYDVKWALYVDDVSATHPVGTPFVQGTGHKLQIWSWAPPTSLALHGPLPPPPVYDFWTQAVDATESGGSVAPYVPPGQFLTNALALSPVLHIDFEDFTPVTGTGGILALTPPIQLLDLTAPTEYYYDETTTVSYESPVGKGMGDPTGWWAGASVMPSRTQMASLFSSGFTIVSVSNPFNSEAAVDTYMDVTLSLRVNSSFNAPDTGLHIYYVGASVSNYDEGNSTEGVVGLYLSWYPSASGAGQWFPGNVNMELPKAVLPFFDGEHHVYAFTCIQSSPSTITAALYVDGVEIHSGDMVAPGTLVVDSTVGSFSDFDPNTGSGSCAEYLIYDRVLTPAEIATLTL